MERAEPSTPGSARGIVLLAGAAMALLLLAGTPAARAAYPGTDGRIAFVRDGGIYSVKSDGTGILRLTTVAGDSQPVWSPDGRRIAFVRGGQIWTMNANGSAQTRVTSAGGAHPTWSPDGRWLAFDRGSVYKLRSTPPYGKAVLLAAAGAGDACPVSYKPAWSATGTIAYIHDQRSCDPDDVGPSIYTINPDGSGKTFITRCACFDMNEVNGPDNQIDWGPRGFALLYVNFIPDPLASGPGFFGGSDVYVHLANGTTTNLSAGLATYYYDQNAAYSPSGSRIVFDRRYTNPYQGTTGVDKALGIWMMNADGSARHRIVAIGSDPNWGRLP